MRWAIRPVCIVLACAFAVTACEPESESLPSEMLQVWRSDAPQYQHRYFELRDGWVIFGTGGPQFRMYAVEHVESEPVSGGGRSYTIRYRADDGESVPVRITHQPGPRPRLWFENHEEIWIPGPTPAPTGGA